MQGDLLEKLYCQYDGGAVGLAIGDSAAGSMLDKVMVHLHRGGRSHPLADRKFL